MNALSADGSPRIGEGRGRRASARNLLFGLSLALACQSVFAQAMYRIKPLGYLGGCTTSAPVAHGFNGSDEVTGTACNANGDTHAFLWKNNGAPMVDLGPNERGSTSAGNALNASGLVAGSATDSTGSFAFVSSGNSSGMTRIYDGLGSSFVAALAINSLGQVTGYSGDHAFFWTNDGSAMVVLKPLDYFFGEIGTSINNSGQITGNAYDGDRGFYAFIWKNNGSRMVDMGNLAGARNFPCCINASGQVAGDASVYSTYEHFHAFVWKNDGSGMQDLGTLGTNKQLQSSASAQNNSGQIVGFASTRYPDFHAFIWMNDGTPMKDLGTFGGTRSAATDLNASGEVTGWAFLAGGTTKHAFLWRNDGTKLQDLNALIDSSDPLQPYVTLTNGNFINEQGDVVAQGTDSRTGQSGLYLVQGTVLTLAPRSLAFAGQRVNTISATKSVTLTNTGLKSVAIANVALTGTASGQFAQTNNCGKSLVGHKTCSIKVKFTPTAKGVKSAFLDVNGGGGGLRTVTLTGTGT